MSVQARSQHQRTPDTDASESPLPDCKVKRNYACPSCNFFTQNPREHLYHLRDTHDERVKIYECSSCLYASRHFQKLTRHSKMVHGGSDMSFSVQKQSRKRRASSEDEDVVVDNINEEIGNEDEIPLEDNSRPSVFKCSVCEFSSRNQNQMTKHEREEHIKTKFFRCSKCTYVTHIKARYTKHVKYHSMPMIKCDMCDFRTPYKWNLDRHCKNHNGKGAFRCSACNFTADIKQSLTVHEMNHHVPPVGQAAGLGVGRRRNKVGASDSTAAEEQQQHQQQPVVRPQTPVDESSPAKKLKVSDFLDPDDIVHHSNGKVYIKTKCKLCNFKTPWDSEMAKHVKKFHNIDNSSLKKNQRPIPNLIPIPVQAVTFKNQRNQFPVLKVAEIPEPSEPMMSQKDMNDICAKSSNSALKDFASLFSSEDVFKNENKVPDLIPTSIFASQKGKKCDFKSKNASFFDKLKEKLEQGTGCNLFCNICGHESKCLTEQVKHQKICGKETNKVQNLMPVHNISSSRCQYCRQRCKSSADLYNHLQTCGEAMKSISNHSDTNNKECSANKEDDTLSEPELKIDEDSNVESKPHPMENRVFVWNDIMVPMDIEVDDSNYEYTEDKVDDNVSLDLSIRTQSPACSEHSFVGSNSHETNNNTTNINNHTHIQQHNTTPEKVPTHGNDITIAQHKRVFKCPHCTFWASTASRFHVHIVGHLNKKPFECSLCSYRSNWRWDITKHIKLKSVRDAAHETAKVLMTDETGRRNYTKYNKYLTEIPVSSLQSSETSGGSGTRPKNHASTSREAKAKLPISGDFNSLLKSSRPMPGLRAADSQLLSKISQERKSGKSGDNKRTLFKCKKCNFRDASRDVLLDHVRRHYEDPQQPTAASVAAQQPAFPASQVTAAAVAAVLGLHPPFTQDLTLRGTSPDRDEASVNNGRAGGAGGAQGAHQAHAPFRCGHCNQVSNWKHVIQRHCRLKHSGDVRVVSNKNGQEKTEVEDQADEPDHSDQPHDTDTVFPCPVCKINVDTKQEFIDHLKTHGITGENDETFKKLSEVVDISKKFRCATCPYVTNSKSQYTYHKQFHKPGGGQYTCTHCSYNVSKRHLLHQHLKVHGISLNVQKHCEEVIEIDDCSEDIDDKLNNDVPLVWVSKNNKFSKMYKCRFCPHVNQRKINIQEHEKMHNSRDKLQEENEHRCKDCTYVCNNAGVLSSHSKVHQGSCGFIHKLVDPNKSDEDEIRELSQKISLKSDSNSTVECDNENESDEMRLYFCKECPARFLKENEYFIHKKLHNSFLNYTCDFCSYTSKEKSYLMSHLNVHTLEYQERTKVLKNMYNTSSNHTQPNVISKVNDNETVYVVTEENNSNNSTLAAILNSAKPTKSCNNVPLSGTELFQRKSEAQQNEIVESSQNEKISDTQFDNMTNGNPEFTYQTYLKNGKMKEKRYKCQKCPSAFEKREQYKIHIGLHGAKHKYRCETCDYSVKYYAIYSQHLKKHKYSDDANAARKCDDDMEVEIDESQEISKVSTADQQISELLDQKNMKDECKMDEKKPYWCQHCPYTSYRRDSVENHQKRHVIVSGVTSSFTCEHCDYSVPQSHFLREHTKLHFVQNKVNQLDGYMVCDSLKLEASSGVIFEEGALGPDKFNNNAGERSVVDVQTGDLVVRDSDSIEVN